MLLQAVYCLKVIAQVLTLRFVFLSEYPLLIQIGWEVQ
jgi:hypothetical protein